MSSLCPAHGREAQHAGPFLPLPKLQLIDSARARLGDGEFMSCALENERRAFSCPAQGEPGGGVYEVEVVSAGATHTSKFEVLDDGCNVFTATFYIELE